MNDPRGGGIFPRKEEGAIETLAYALTVLLIILVTVLDHWHRK